MLNWNKKNSLFLIFIYIPSSKKSSKNGAGARISLNRPQLRYQTTVIICAQQPIVLLPTMQLQQ